ncbi:iron-containing alcohol dehydrogenase PsrA [Devosia nitrariae]|uniref:Methanol dehydrogenase n=1 Tax=Devosia nitrariae TaxID=2071872 RepID=A0ABQ5WD32_9HYPH|nr:iron-containing alcohol dehydrogenase PsrA [Devosia nitrariae]GLQ57996.1 methanol dehydrogenase [Devosia nitrariae]
MSIWTYANPVKLRFGEGALDDIGALAAGRPYLLVTHPEGALQVWRNRVIERAGTPLVVVDDIEPNPSLQLLEHICARIGEARIKPELIIALGGGSVIDSAKFLAAGHCAYASVVAYLEEGTPTGTPSLPLIAVPTTSGTGSDLTKWATIWDPVRGRKLSLDRDDLYAEAALVDPRLTASLPWSLTLATGLDAFSHALESIWNRNANPVTRGYAVQAARDILTGLPRLQADLDDKDARRLLALGAARAGLAFSNTQTALAHNISYAITLGHGVPHGIACSFCLPEVMLAARGVSTECDAALTEIFADLAVAPAKLRTFLSSLGVAGSPLEFGVAAKEWRAIVADAFDGPRGRNFIGTIEQFPAL